jgi:alkanesulfonate monooxygenase SsuD/methylene tetrahydromethanopterin reductase-like flavin-dependent oxidoreductase (luciferase family)
MVAIIGGEFRRFRPLIDIYRQAGQQMGYPPERLKVGVHAIGFVGTTNEEAKDAFFPGWQYMFTEIGRERGWAPATRAQFEAMCGPQGAYLIGDPATVAAKMLTASEALGGVSRITFQMSSASLAHEAMKRSIQLLGADVAPIVRHATLVPAI